MASKRKSSQESVDDSAEERNEESPSNSQKKPVQDRVFTNGARYLSTENDLSTGSSAVKTIKSEHDLSLNTCVCRNKESSEGIEDRNILSDGESENIERERACLKYKSCIENSCNSNLPSASGVGKPSTSSDQDSLSCHINSRLSNLGLQNSDDADHSSSDTGNDDYSLGSEDGCIYTYRGGQNQNHLPGFIPLPQENIQINRQPTDRASSPEMDFLEMDFDPGPSCEADSEDEMHEQRILDNLDPVIHLPIHNEVPHPVNIVNEVPNSETIHESHEPTHQDPSAIEAVEQNSPVTFPQACGNILLHRNARGQLILVRRTRISSPPPYAMMQHTPGGDLIHPRLQLRCESNSLHQPAADTISSSTAYSEEENNLSSALYHCTMAKKLVLEKASTSFIQEPDISNLEIGGCDSKLSEVERTMIWSEREAFANQVTQIGASACGATAVINVFLALNVPVDVDKIKSEVGTRQRANNAPLPRYLLSRAAAGCTAADLVRALTTASDGRLFARFFPTHPEQAMSLSHWLADWITLGAVPILTLNLQKGAPSENGEIADAWHHQMVFGVSSRGVFLCNPMQCVPESVLWPQLCSESVLLVRNEDIVKRWTQETDLSILADVWPDPRWASINVLGQVVRILRGGTGLLRIPCSYRAGITLAALTSSPAYAALQSHQ